MTPLLLSSLALAGALPISPETPGNCQSPRWSLDGSQLAYEVNFHDRKAVEQYIYRPGKSLEQVTPMKRGASAITSGFTAAGGEDVVHELDWSPSFMNTFVYTASGPDQDYDIYLNGGARVGSGPGADGAPRWSPNGQWIVYTSARTGQGDLYLLDVYDLEKPPVRMSFDADASELYAAWNHDGTALAFVGHTRTGDSIYTIADLENPSPKLLIKLGETQTRPSWSPDSSKVAFYSNHTERERFDLYVVSAGGGAPTLLQTGVNMNQDGPTWTPDGKHLIAVLDDDEKFDPVIRVGADGGSVEAIATGTVGNGDLDVVEGTNGKTYLAISAQGRTEDKVRDFKRIYVMELN